VHVQLTPKIRARCHACSVVPPRSSSPQWRATILFRVIARMARGGSWLRSRCSTQARRRGRKRLCRLPPRAPAWPAGARRSLVSRNMGRRGRGSSARSRDGTLRLKDVKRAGGAGKRPRPRRAEAETTTASPRPQPRKSARQSPPAVSAACSRDGTPRRADVKRALGAGKRPRLELEAATRHPDRRPRPSIPAPSA